MERNVIMSTNIIKENFLNNNLIRVTDGEYTSDNITVTVTEGRIKCIGNTGDSSEIIRIPINNSSLIGKYNFSMQNIKYNAFNYPTVFLDNKSYTHLVHIYGTADLSYKNFEISEEDTIYKIALSFAENSSFDIEFDLMLQEGELRKKFIPYESSIDKIDFLSEINDNVVRPYAFGAVGNGEIDDTAALQATINYALANNKKIILDGGCTYLISKTLKFYGAHLWFDGQGATIKVNDNIIVPSSSDGSYKIINAIDIDVISDIVYDVPKENNISLYNKSTYICRVFKNLTLDCNCGTARCGLNILNGGKVHFSNIMVCDPSLYGIQIKGGNEAVFDNIHLTRSRVKDRIENGGETIQLNCDSIGLAIKSSDIYIHDCVAIDFKTGFLNSGSDNHYSRCHPWNAYTQNIISKSIGFDVTGGYATFSQCISDSVRYGWVLRGTAKVFMTNCCNAYSSLYVNNKETYGEPVLFYFDKTTDTEHLLKGKGLVISSSYFKSVDGLVCHFDNLTSEEDSIIIDSLFNNSFVDIHVSEAQRNAK